MLSSGTARSIRIGLLWHSANSGNLGVGALTVANIAIIQGVAAECGLVPKFTIIGMRDANAAFIDDPAVAVVAVDGRSLLSPFGCAAVLADQDVVIDIGAGDSFTDLYGPKRFAFLWWTKVLAIRGGRTLLLAPQTIGPFSGGVYKWLARWALDRARAVVARDEASLTFLKKLAPSARAFLAADVAFALPYTDCSEERGAEGTVRVGVNVSGLLFREATSGRNRFGLEIDYAQLMRSFIDDLVSRPNVEVHLLTHANGAPEDDDRWIADELAAEFPGVVRVADFAGPSEAKTYISGLDFVVAGRMHACIAAYSSGTPVVPVAYSRKFSGLFGMLDYPWMVPVKGMHFDEARKFLMDCFERRGELSQRSAVGMVKAVGLLDAYRAELRGILEQSGSFR